MTNHNVRRLTILKLIQVNFMAMVIRGVGMQDLQCPIIHIRPTLLSISKTVHYYWERWGDVKEYIVERFNIVQEASSFSFRWFHSFCNLKRLVAKNDGSFGCSYFNSSFNKIIYLIIISLIVYVVILYRTYCCSLCINCLKHLRHQKT